MKKIQKYSVRESDEMGFWSLCGVSNSILKDSLYLLNIEFTVHLWVSYNGM